MFGGGALAAALEYVTHEIVEQLQAPLALHAALDALIIGAIMTSFIGVLITGVRARRTRVVDEMRTVSELNHHVRNALQVIRDSHYLPEDEQPKAVLESVDRIDQTLRRLFPSAPPRS